MGCKNRLIRKKSKVRMNLFEKYRTLVNKRLNELLKLSKGNRLLEAQAYAVLSDASRYRPIFLLCAAQTFGRKPNSVLDSACAVEFVHSATVMISDMPQVEFTLLRRERLPTYRMFGGACSVLAACALFGRAFELLCSNLESLKIEKPKALEAIKSLAYAIGLDGLPSGIWNEYRLTEDRVELIQDIHAKRTAILFSTAGKIGGILGGAKKSELEILEICGRNIGLAVRIIEDIWEYWEGQDSSRKPARKGLRPANLVKLIGQETARDMAKSLITSSQEALKPFGKGANILASFADYVLSAGLVRKI